MASLTRASPAQAGASLCGAGAIVLWSLVVGLMRDVSEHFTPLAGGALVETIGGAFLVLLAGLPRFSRDSAWVLLVGGALFMGCEAGLALALGLAVDRTQAMEVGVVNYLWPSLTVLVAVPINHEKLRPLIIPAIATAVAGLFLVLGEGRISARGFAGHVVSHPLCYAIALFDAVSWALYCAFMRRYGREQRNVTGLFFLCTACVLWGLYAFLPGPCMRFSLADLPLLLCAAISLSAGYALWNIGILRGNARLLVALSYFTPVLSSVFSALWLHVSVGAAFWEGVALLALGSLLSAGATRAA